MSPRIVVIGGVAGGMSATARLRRLMEDAQIVVLALPAAFDLAPLVVVTQTLVELVAMVVFVRVIPRVIPADARASGTAASAP